MINYFPKIKFTHFTLTILIEIFIVLLLSPDHYIYFNEIDSNIYLSKFNIPLGTITIAWLNFILIAFLIMIITTAIAMKIANDKHNKMLDVLLENCDPDEFIKIYEPLTIKYKKLDKAKKVVLSNYALGLSSSGDNKNAIKTMQKILETPAVKKENLNYAIFYCNLCNFYLNDNIEDIDNAKIALEKSKEFLLQCKKSKLYEIGLSRITTLKQKIMLLEGDLELPLKFYLNSLDTSKTKLIKVDTHYQIAKIYKQMDNTEQEILHLKYVAVNGNSLTIACKARVRLKEINS